MTTQKGIPGRAFEHAVPNPETRKLIAARYTAGESAWRLAVQFGISSRTVLRYAAELGEVSA